MWFLEIVSTAEMVAFPLVPLNIKPIAYPSDCHPHAKKWKGVPRFRDTDLGVVPCFQRLDATPDVCLDAFSNELFIASIIVVLEARPIPQHNQNSNKQTALQLPHFAIITHTLLWHPPLPPKYPTCINNFATLPTCFRGAGGPDRRLGRFGVGGLGAHAGGGGEHDAGGRLLRGERRAAAINWGCGLSLTMAFQNRCPARLRMGLPGAWVLESGFGRSHARGLSLFNDERPQKCGSAFVFVLIIFVLCIFFF